MSTGSSEESSGSSGLQDEVMSPSSEAVFAWPNYSVSPCPSQDTTEEHRSVSQIGTSLYTQCTVCGSQIAPPPLQGADHIIKMN